MSKPFVAHYVELQSELNLMLASSLKYLYQWLIRARSCWWIQKARFICKIKHSKLTIGAKITASVPIRCDGSGSVEVADNVALGYLYSPRYGDGEILLQSRQSTATIKIGSNTSFSNNISLIANAAIELGEHCLVGDQVTIVDSDFHAINYLDRDHSQGLVEPISIGNNVWIGTRAIIMKGVSIGDNTVIGAGSIVVNSLPENVIAAGNPAAIIREIKSN